MGCFGVYLRRDAAERTAGGETMRFIVPARLDGHQAWAVVDSFDRDKEVHYDRAAPPGQRLTMRKTNAGAPVERSGDGQPLVL